MSIGGICIAGPTAAGKTDAALEVAMHLGGRAEIISVDSALVYRNMDVGTAKPSAAERSAVVHHLIDIRDPRESYSAAEFVRDARSLIAQIQQRGNRPLLVGGTMLYFKALFDGLAPMPPADPTVRAEIDAQAAALGWPALHAELARHDPVTAARLAPMDAQRIQRALEVWRVSGRSLSDWHAEGQTDAGTGWLPLLSLEPTDRAWLHARIAQRFDAMLVSGLIPEVERLRARGDLHPDMPSMRCVGYRQTWEALDESHGLPLSDVQRSKLRERGVAATRQLAKRQITWLRAMPQRHVVACDEPDVLAQVLAWVDAQA